MNEDVYVARQPNLQAGRRIGSRTAKL